MSLLFPVIVSGIAIGLVYGLLGFATVFLYKTTGVLNFAIGNMGMFSAFVAYELHQGPIGNWPLAVVLAVALSGVFGGVLYVIIVRPRESAGPLNLLARTLALYLLLSAIVNFVWGTGQPFLFPSVLPEGGWTVGSARIAQADAWTAVGCAVIVVASSFLLKRTNLGLQFLALADNRASARLIGVPVRRMTALAWVLVGFISLLAGIVVAPKQLLSSTMMEPVLLNSLAAVIVGGMTSLGGGFLGGILIGVASNLVSTYIGADLAIVGSFAILLLTLLFRPHGLFGTSTAERV